MYNYGYGYGYQPQSYQPSAYQQYNSTMTAGRQEVTRVSGENGAKAYQLPPNSSVLLLDETAPIVWLKTTDGAGYPTVSAYSITPYQTEPQTSMTDIESRVKRLEEIVNAKPDTVSNGEPKSNVK